MNALNDTAQNDSGKFHPEDPVDFDSLAYLVLNPDVLHVGVDSIQHFIDFSKRDERAYKFLNR